MRGEDGHPRSSVSDPRPLAHTARPASLSRSAGWRHSGLRRHYHGFVNALHSSSLSMKDGENIYLAIRPVWSSISPMARHSISVKTAIAKCSLMSSYAARHPEYGALLDG